MKVYITIDVEEDSWGNFTPEANSVKNIDYLPLAQKLFDKYGAVPTYLVNWPVVSTKTSQDILKSFVDSGRCEIGMHCHSWNTPPFGNGNQDNGGVMYSLPEDVVYKKLQTLHEGIMDRLNVTPVSFRAGRNCFDSKIARCIDRLGYKIDTSVTPFMDWSEWGGPDFTCAPTTTYRFDPENVLKKKEDGRLLQVPATIGFCQRNMEKAFSARNWLVKSPLARLHILGILDRLKLINFYILSPEQSTGDEMIRLAKNFHRLGYRFLNLNFHSNSLMPGENPFAASTHGVEKVLHSLEAFLKFAADAGFEFCPLRSALLN